MALFLLGELVVWMPSRATSARAWIDHLLIVLMIVAVIGTVQHAFGMRRTLRDVTAAEHDADVSEDTLLLFQGDLRTEIGRFLLKAGLTITSGARVWSTFGTGPIWLVIVGLVVTIVAVTMQDINSWRDWADRAEIIAAGRQRKIRRLAFWPGVDRRDDSPEEAS